MRCLAVLWLLLCSVKSLSVQREAAVVHLNEGDWAIGHGRRLARSCHARLLLKPRGGGLEHSRRLARSLSSVHGLRNCSWHHLTRLSIDIAELDCQDVNATLKYIAENFAEQLEFIELDEQIYFPQGLPVDPLWTSQWGTQRVGFAGAWAQLEALTTTPSDVVVALIDTGMNFNHEDLQGRFWVNTGEIPGNGVDDDFNGFVDDVNGFNIVDRNGSPVDDGGHGTHNAGIIAAQLNNLGVAGAAGRNQHIKLMVVKALTSQGGYKSDAIEALNYAMAMGAEISSNSWGGHSESPAMQSAIQVAMEEGHLFVSAAGNDNNNADQYPFYPCVYPHVLCVAASNQEDQFTFFTNYGVESVELVAPGQDIVSTYLGNMQYSSLTGTSFGTSIVAGAAALLFSWLRTATSTVKTVEDIRWLLLETAEELSWTTGFIGNGMLDVNAAVAKALSGVDFSWLVGPWSLCRRANCDTSSTGVRTRLVSCVGFDGLEVDISKCSDGPECQDSVPNWRDSYGAACSVYGSYQWCNSAGSYGIGWQSFWGKFQDYTVDGYDATTVCCACGSGVMAASNVPFSSQECPAPIGGPDEDGNGVDDCMVPAATSTATATTVSSVTVTSTTVSTATWTSVTRTSSSTWTRTTSTATTSTRSSMTRTSSSSSSSSTSATVTLTRTSATTYSTVTSTSTTSLTSSSTSLTSTSSTWTSSSTSSQTWTSSTSSTQTATSVTSSSSSATITSLTTSSTTHSSTSSSSTTETRSSTTTSTRSSTTSSTSATSTTTTSATSTSTSSSSSSSFTGTSTSSTSTTLTVQLATVLSTIDFVQSTLLLVGTNQTPAGLERDLGEALAGVLQLEARAVAVVSMKAAVAAMFFPGRALQAEARRAQMTVLEPALETEFQILLPLGSSMTVSEALAAVSALKGDPQPLRLPLAEVVEAYGLVPRENVSLRLTSPSAARVESAFVTSRWGPCAGGAVCTNVVVPLRWREVWCAKLPDLASSVAEGFCSGPRPSVSEPCLERLPTCGWVVSNWSICHSSDGCPNGQGIQEREVSCLSDQADGCSETKPGAERACQCVMSVVQEEAQALPADSPEEPHEGDGMSMLLPSILGVGTLCCCCCLLGLLVSRSAKKVGPKERSEAWEEKSETRPAPEYSRAHTTGRLPDNWTEAAEISESSRIAGEAEDTSSRKTVAELRAECEQRGLSTKGCLERRDLEKLLEGQITRPQAEQGSVNLPLAEPQMMDLPDRPSSPASPARVQHIAAEEENEEEDNEPVVLPANKRPAGARTTSESSTLSGSSSSTSQKSSEGTLRSLAGGPKAMASPHAPNAHGNTQSVQSVQSVRDVSNAGTKSQAKPELRKTATWAGTSHTSRPGSGSGLSPSRSRGSLAPLARSPSHGSHGSRASSHARPSARAPAPTPGAPRPPSQGARRAPR